MIRFEKYRWKYHGSAQWTLDEISLQIEPNELIILTGPSGSGKSTIAMAIAALLADSHPGTAGGRLIVDGCDITNETPRAMAGKVGLVTQRPDANFATLNIEDELAFSMENQCVEPDEIKKRTEAAIKSFGLEQLKGRSTSKLSEGQKQRLAIAAAITAEPKILILDEPTANLDPDAAEDVLNCVQKLAKNKRSTVIIIEQKLTGIQNIQGRIINIENGKITEKPAQNREIKSRQPKTDLDQNGEPAVTVDSLVIKRDETVVLDGVSLTIRPGETVAIMGPNGSGKSTLLLGMTGLLPKKIGTIKLCGKTVEKNKIYQIAKNTGLIFQNPEHQLFADTVWDEAVFAAGNFNCNKQKTAEAAEKMLGEAGLAEKKLEHPYRLSYGQKRRLNLVSSTLHDIKVLMLDEPFVGQDPDNIDWLIETIGRASEKQIATLIVTHEPDIVRRICDRVIFLKNGKIVCDETTQNAWQKIDELGLKNYLPTETNIT